jgi:hypothetical protein
MAAKTPSWDWFTVVVECQLHYGRSQRQKKVAKGLQRLHDEFAIEYSRFRATMIIPTLSETDIEPNPSSDSRSEVPISGTLSNYAM